MALTNAIGNSPVLFTDDGGKQVSIPLSVLQFDGATIKPDGWPPYSSLSSAEKQTITDWLNRLVQSGVIAPNPVPPPSAALVLTAQDPGATGNNIQVVFSKIVPDTTTPGNTKTDIAVSETDTYTGLTPATIGGVLGVGTTAGQRPGLVHVKTAGAFVLPKAGDYTLAGGNGGKASKDIDKNSGAGAAFTLEAKRDGADGNSIKVTIKDVDATGQTFTLVAAWTKSAAGVKLSDITTSFGFLIKADPPSGGVFAPPAPTTVVLVGGADSTGAIGAKATVMAG